jgi:predicted RNase H-like HicB family nuclease
VVAVELPAKVANAREAIELTLEDMEAAGEPIPRPRGEIVG